MNSAQLTTRKIQTGIFEVLWNGKPTEYHIENGSMGLSGRDTSNIYCIYKPSTGFIKQIGPLNTCKALLADKFKREGRA
jgi:hypothetical protein